MQTARRPTTMTKSSSEPTSDPVKWIDRYMGRYRARFDPHDWPRDPDEMAEFTAVWVAAFERRGVEEGEANAAMMRLAECPPSFRNQHLPAILEIVREMRNPPSNVHEQTTQDRLARAAEAERRQRTEGRLQQRWDALSDEQRDAIRAEVVAEHPGLARWDAFVQPLCLARLQAMGAQTWQA